MIRLEVLWFFTLIKNFIFHPVLKNETFMRHFANLSRWNLNLLLNVTGKIKLLKLKLVSLVNDNTDMILLGYFVLNIKTIYLFLLKISRKTLWSIFGIIYWVTSTKSEWLKFSNSNMFEKSLLIFLSKPVNCDWISLEQQKCATLKT